MVYKRLEGVGHGLRCIRVDDQDRADGIAVHVSGVTIAVPRWPLPSALLCETCSIADDGVQKHALAKTRSNTSSFREVPEVLP